MKDSAITTGVTENAAKVNKSFARRCTNRILGRLAQAVPGKNTLRPFLHRLRGIQIGKDVFIGDQVYLENEYPECIEIHDKAQICLRSVIIAHFRGSGRVIIGKNVWIGPNCVIATSPGRTLTIGDDSVIGALTVVTSDIAPNSFVVGAKPKIVAKVTTPMTEQTGYHEFLRGLIPLQDG